MTKLLKKAFDQVSKLPEEEQNAIANRLLEELEDEQRWAKSFAETQDELAQLAAEAREEFRAGRTYPLDFNRRKRRAK